MSQKYYIISFLIAAIINSSCQREDEITQIDSDTTTAKDHALAEFLFNEVQTIADQAQQGNLGNFREVNDTLYLGCAIIIRDTVSNPKTITVDFGSNNCLCQDGRNRRGKIISSYIGNYRDSGTVITHITEEYFVNDHKINATKTVTNKGKNASNQSWFQIIENGTIIKANNGGTINWSSNRIRKWVNGELTANGVWQDDVYEITGTANGTSSNNIIFSVLITSPLQIKLNCQFISSGKLEFSPSNRPIRHIDFGNEICDNLATVTINGNVYNITLP